MAQVGSCGQEQFQGHLGWLGGIAEDIFGMIGGFDFRTEFVECRYWDKELVLMGSRDRRIRDVLEAA